MSINLFSIIFTCFGGGGGGGGGSALYILKLSYCFSVYDFSVFDSFSRVARTPPPPPPPPPKYTINFF